MRKSVFEATGPSGPCKIAYTDWGDIDNANVVLCVHGLTRNSRDFDELAEALSADYRVICPDIPGRGDSDWLKNPADYDYTTYCRVICDLVSQLATPNINWVGTSMGGIIGMMIAAMPQSPIRKLVINDVGPFIPKAALQRIGTYLSFDFHFQNTSEIENHLREIHAPFGPLTDAQWAHMATHGGRQDEHGQWQLKYDPAISVPFKELADEDISFWEIWDAIGCPSLLLRGENSDILLKHTAEEMTRRGPKTDLIEFKNIGHAPALMADEQIQTVYDWLL